MKILKLVALAFILLPLSTVFSQSELPETVVPKEAWQENMLTAFPASACQAKSYFRRCYNVTQVECEEMAASVIRICLAKNEESMPKSLKMPSEGKAWGKRIGRCAGVTYCGAFKEKFIMDDSRCKDADNWKRQDLSGSGDHKADEI